MPRESDSLYNTVLAELRLLGVRIPRKSKKKKEPPPFTVNPSVVGNIFGQPLAEQDWLSEPPVPSFVNMCTSYLLRCSNMEGLLRKSGSVTRQKDLVNQLEKGMTPKWDELDPHDVAAILKQWLRALPQPVIPSQTAELLVAGLRAEEQSRALRLALLLLPPENLYLLRHLANFLNSLSRDSTHSRMDAHNLAVVMAPNLFPPVTMMLQDFIAVTEALILISSELHTLPQTLSECLPAHARRTRKQSGTFTDLFNGFKKFVVKTPGGSLAATTPAQGPCKRRANGAAVTPCSSRLRPAIPAVTPLTTPSRYKGSPHPNSTMRIRRVQKEVKQSLRRGRPNTVQSGLPRPLSLPADAAAVAQKLQFFSCTEDSNSCQSCGVEEEPTPILPTSYSDSSLLVSESIALSETLSHSKSDFVYLTPCSKENNIQYDSSSLNEEEITLMNRQDSSEEILQVKEDCQDGGSLLTHSSSSSSYSPYPPPLCNGLQFEVLDEEEVTPDEVDAEIEKEEIPTENDCPSPPAPPIDSVLADQPSPKIEPKRRKVSLETEKPHICTPPNQQHLDPTVWTPSKLFNFDTPISSAEDNSSSIKRESIALILTKNAGKVKANVQKFNNITTDEHIFKTPVPAPRKKKLQASAVLADKTNLSINV